MIDESELNILFRYALALCHDADEAYDLLYSNVEKFLSPGKIFHLPVTRWHL